MAKTIISLDQQQVTKLEQAFIARDEKGQGSYWFR